MKVNFSQFYCIDFFVNVNKFSSILGMQETTNDWCRLFVTTAEADVTNRLRQFRRGNGNDTRATKCRGMKNRGRNIRNDVTMEAVREHVVPF